MEENHTADGWKETLTKFFETEKGQNLVREAINRYRSEKLSDLT